jgi:hypothetical protein
LGNVIRSFENYSARQYNMAAIPLWPRLISVIDSGYADAIDSGKAAVDFLLNSATLSGVLALLLAVTGLIDPAGIAAPTSLAIWIAEIGALACCSRWFYGQAIEASMSWGQLVRAAFDLYRGSLLEKLGYTAKPATVTEERALWGAITYRLTAGNLPVERGKMVPYAEAAKPATYATSSANAELQLARGVLRDAGSWTTEIVIEVRYDNANESAPAARELVISDTVPAAFDYQWGSARASDGNVEVEGTNPYNFSLSCDLKPGDTIQLSYLIVPRGTPPAGMGESL